MSNFNQQFTPALSKQTSFGVTLGSGPFISSPSTGYKPLNQNINSLGQNIGRTSFGQTAQLSQQQTGSFGPSTPSFTGQNTFYNGVNQTNNTGLNQSPILNFNANKQLPGQLNQTPSFGKLSPLNINQQQINQFGQVQSQQQQNHVFGAQNTLNQGFGGNNSPFSTSLSQATN